MRAIALLGGLVLCCLPALVAAQAQNRPDRAAVYEDIAVAHRRFAREHPRSCEAVYYGLFLPAASRPEPAARRPANEQQLQQLFDRVKELFDQEILSPRGARDPAMMREFRHRLLQCGLGLEEMEAEGPFLDPGTINHPGAALERLNLRGAPLFHDPAPADKPSVLYNKGAVGSHPLAYDAFFIGHELSHLTDWAADPLADCLATGASVRARRVNEYLQASSLRDLMWSDPDKIHRILRELIKDEKPGRDRSPHGQFAEGWGTDYVEPMRSLLARGAVNEARAFLDQLRREGRLPDQMAEAVADVRGTVAAAAYIREKRPTPEGRKAAALALLRGLPPALFTGEAAAIMNEVGAKKTNEERVLRIILANDAFRDLLGCSMATSPAPVECSE